MILEVFMHKKNKSTFWLTYDLFDPLATPNMKKERS